MPRTLGVLTQPRSTSGPCSSPLARRYALRDLGEAVDYLRDPLLGPRLGEITRLVAARLARGDRLVELMGGRIDALKVVSEGINLASNEQNGLLLVTHYQRILNLVSPDVVHVFMNGRLVRTGGMELVHALEERGYDWLADESAALAEGSRT